MREVKGAPLIQEGKVPIAVTGSSNPSRAALLPARLLIKRPSHGHANCDPEKNCFGKDILSYMYIYIYNVNIC